MDIASLMTSLNLVWILITGFLVMFMQAGFALVEVGMTRIKNANHTMLMNFMVYGIGIIGYFLLGFGLMFGGVGALSTLGVDSSVLNREFIINLFGKNFGLFGLSDFALSGITSMGVIGFFLFQLVFMDTTATIPTGAMAERWKWKAFVIYAFFVSAILYPIYGNWVWGGGWLSQLGANFGLGHGLVDFAGSSVVHMVGGVCAMAGASVLGARIGKFRKDGTPIAIPGHNIPMAILGTFILAFGWFGFNPGSTLAGADPRIAIVAVNTLLASASGAFFAMLYTWWQQSRPDPGMCANGMLAGLVAITAPCAFVSPLAALGIGAIAGVLVCLSVWFIEWVLKIDDPVGAISVHGVNGLWGILSLGIFANGTYGDGLNGVSGMITGILYGDSGQFFAQLMGGIVCFTFVFTLSYLFFKIQHMIMGIRVSAEEEIVGLDRAEMTSIAYPRDVM
jgi:Amt family ammonium transporter